MLPNFLVVGAAKCGTTSLHEYLNQHESIYVPSKKECMFFSNLTRFEGPGHDQELNNLITRSIEEYEALFAPVRDEVALGDVSHDYLYYFQESIRNIKRYLGDQVCIVMILRDPRERAYSHYMHHVKVGISPDATFERALAQEETRIESGWSWNWHYTRVGFYSRQVEAYLEAFSRVRVYLFEDLVADAQVLMDDLFAFLGVPSGVAVEAEIHNKGSDTRSRKLTTFLKRENAAKERIRGWLKTMGLSDKTIHNLKKRALVLNAAEKRPMDTRTRERLTGLFAADTERLQALIGRDLGAWRD